MKTIPDLSSNLLNLNEMKKRILSLGLMCAAALALTNCDKQSTEPQLPTEGTPFEIIASTVDTKTTNDGLKTVWAANDALNVFRAEAGDSDYGSNYKFTFTGSDNKFTSELTPASEGSYDWYALYPYSDKVGTPAATESGWIYVGQSKGATQKENNNTEHLCGTLCPLYGVIKNVSADATVAIKMHHLTSVVKIGVTNTNDTPLKVNTIVFTATEDIVGTFYVNFVDPSNITFTSSSTSTTNYTFPSATLNVTNGEEIAKNETAYFYIPIKPITAASGSTLKISVNGYEKSLTMPRDIIFKAGEIKEVAFNYDKTTVVEESVAKFVAEKIGSGYGPHEGVESNGYKWTVTYGQQTYIGTNSSKKANCKLGSSYEKVGTPCGYSADQTQVAAVISESKFSNVSKVVVDGDTDKYNPEKISLVYSVDGTSYTLIETKDYSKTTNEFTFDKIDDAYYAVVLYYGGTSYMRTNNLAITFYE